MYFVLNSSLNRRVKKHKSEKNIKFTKIIINYKILVIWKYINIYLFRVMHASRYSLIKTADSVDDAEISHRAPSIRIDSEKLSTADIHPNISFTGMRVRDRAGRRNRELFSIS